MSDDEKKKEESSTGALIGTAIDTAMEVADRDRIPTKSHPILDDKIREALSENTKRVFDYSQQIKIQYDNPPVDLHEVWADVNYDDIQFNELCARIKETVADDFVWQAPFNPYEDISQLSQIVEMVLSASGQPFVVNAGFGANMISEMREYIEVYSGEEYMSLVE